VTDFHGSKAAEDAAEEFRKVFAKKEIPEEIEEYRISPREIPVLDILVQSGLTKSKAEARRMIRQGAVSIGKDSSGLQKITDEMLFLQFRPGDVLVFKMGSHRFKKIVAATEEK
jgi:tyrosyl-tRNA synthetase